jgi:hypothetical protein
MKKTGIKPTKVGVIFIIAVMSFAAIGAGYAHWQEILTIEGTMTTDDIHPMFAKIVSNDDPDSILDYQLDPTTCGEWGYDEDNDDWNWGGSRRDKNVGNTDVTTSNDDQTLNIIINDAYPCYYSHVAYMIRNTGSCPVLTHRELMLEELSIQTDPDDPNTHHVINIQDRILDLYTKYYVDIYQNKNLVWKAKIVEEPVSHPENYDFMLEPTGSEKLYQLNVQLDPWSWKDNKEEHMETPDDYLGQIPGDLCIHFENGCMQDVIYDFKFGMIFWNWPEFCVPPEIPPVNYPEEGNVYIGYEDWGNGDFDYNDFGMYFNAVEYSQGPNPSEVYLTQVTMTFLPEIYDSGADHNIHIERTINGPSTVTVTRTSSAYGSETPAGIYPFTGDVDVILFDTAKYPKPSKEIHQNTGEQVTVDILVGDPSLNPKTTPTPPRWDVDPFWGNYDPWEVGTSGIINGVAWHISDMQTVTGVTGSHPEVLDTRLIDETLPYILVVPSNNWVPPYEDSSISGPRTTTNDWGPYGYFYDYYSTTGASHPNWYNENTDPFVGLGGLSWS